MRYIKLSTAPSLINKIYGSWSSTRKLVFAAILSIFAALLQSFGGFLPVIGFLISPFAIVPILLVAMISLQHGFLSYFLTIFLLVLIQPSELFIFPFTTGLLGLGIGWGLRILNRRISIILINCIVLFIGICVPLFVLGFPILGPAGAVHDPKLLIMILGFTIIYSWFWLEISLYLLYKLSKVL